MCSRHVPLRERVRGLWETVLSRFFMGIAVVGPSESHPARGRVVGGRLAPPHDVREAESRHGLDRTPPGDAGARVARENGRRRPDGLGARLRSRAQSAQARPPSPGGLSQCPRAVVGAPLEEGPPGRGKDTRGGALVAGGKIVARGRSPRSLGAPCQLDRGRNEFVA